ncbi:MAG: disulfide bond formation protein B [Halioglobus sp.]
MPLRSATEETTISLLNLNFWQRHQRALGIVTIAIGLGAWGMEFAGTVYICPYCRVQRTVIAVLGLIMVLPGTRPWILQYLASVIGFFGAVVAVNQNFMGWAKMSRGEFAFNEQLYIDPFILSGGALFIIIGQLWLILGKRSATP